MTKPKSAAALYLIIIIALLFQTATAEQKNSIEPLKIGLTLSLTGKYAKMADMQLKGFKVWENKINSRGGILGRKVRLIAYDDRSDFRTAPGLYEHLITKDRVDLLFAPYSSEITEAVLPITERYGYPLIVSGASANRIWQRGYRYAFGIYTPASGYATGFLEMLVMSDLTSIAILYADDSFSIDIAEGTKQWAERFGLKTLLWEKFRKEGTDFDALAKKTKASSAQVLILCGHFNESVAMRRALKGIGWYPRAYFASVGPSTQAFHAALKVDADYVFSSSQWEHYGGLQAPGCNEFYEAFLTTYREGPSYHAATAYAAGQILEAAILRTGSLDRRGIRNTLATMDTLSIIGRYGVNKKGMQIKHFYFTTQWQKGKKEVVWPVELRTAPPVFK